MHVPVYRKFQFVMICWFETFGTASSLQCQQSWLKTPFAASGQTSNSVLAFLLAYTVSKRAVYRYTPRKTVSFGFYNEKRPAPDSL